MILITDELAQRLEMAEAVDAAACAEAACCLDEARCAAVKSIGGAYLTFCGPASPLTHGLALGMHGPVTPEEIEEIEDFFVSRDAPVVLDVTAHSHPSLREALSERGYRVGEFNNVLVRQLQPGEDPPQCLAGTSVRLARSDEQELYARTVVSGFLSRSDLNEEEMMLGRILFAMPQGRSYLAEVNGEIAGGCGMSMRGGVASCYGDSTLPVFRSRGAHTAMICARIAAAMEAGCDVMTAGTVPGSTSQRNYQRMGFVVAYSKISMVLG